MPGIKEELISFFIAVVSGGVIRLAYQCITCIRGIFRHRLLLIELEDALYWMSVAIYLFVQIYYTSNGSIRWYFALGVVLGAVVSTFFLGKIKKVLKKIYDFHAGKNIAKNGKKRYYNKY